MKNSSHCTRTISSPILTEYAIEKGDAEDVERHACASGGTKGHAQKTFDSTQTGFKIIKNDAAVYYAIAYYLLLQ